jgi:hypothetical protein
VCARVYLYLCVWGLALSILVLSVSLVLDYSLAFFLPTATEGTGIYLVEGYTCHISYV